MRSPPAPTLQNVLVSHPSSQPQRPPGTLATPEDILSTATAALVAEEAHDLTRRAGAGAAATSGSGFIARATRRWHSIFHRRSSRRRHNHHNHHGNNNNYDVTNAATALSTLRIRPTRGNRPNQTSNNPPTQLIEPPTVTYDESSRATPFHASPDLSAASSHSATKPSNHHQQPVHSQSPLPSPSQQQQPSVIHLPAPNSLISENTSRHEPNHSVQQPKQSCDFVGDTRPPTTNAPLPFSLPSATSRVILSRESELRAERQEQLALDRIDDDDDFDEFGVASPREPSSLRVRQVGARIDDDILLQLPRIQPVSLSTGQPSSSSSSFQKRSNLQQHQQRSQEPISAKSIFQHYHQYTSDISRSTSNDNLYDTQKVRQLPRVSGLMPMRPVRAPTDNTSNSANNSNDPSASSSSSFNRHRRSLSSTPQYNYDTSRNENENAITQQQQFPYQHYQQPRIQSSLDPIVGNSSSDLFDDNDYMVDVDIDDDLEDDDDDDNDLNNSVLKHGNLASYDDNDDDNNSNNNNKRNRLPRVPAQRRIQRIPIARLPTGMSRRDVEREMERAVVEIASEGDSDSSNDQAPPPQPPPSEPAASNETNDNDNDNQNKTETELSGKVTRVVSSMMNNHQHNYNDDGEDAARNLFANKNNTIHDKYENNQSSFGKKSSLRTRCSSDIHDKNRNRNGNSNGQPYTRRLSSSNRQPHEQSYQQHKLIPTSNVPSSSSRSSSISPATTTTTRSGGSGGYATSITPEYDMYENEPQHQEYEKACNSNNSNKSISNKISSSTPPLQPFGTVNLNRRRLSSNKRTSKNNENNNVLAAMNIVGAGSTTSATTVLLADRRSETSSNYSVGPRTPPLPRSQQTHLQSSHIQEPQSLKLPKNQQDIALFEDDYLSFQGFHQPSSTGQATSGVGASARHYYQAGVGALLRAKRISSVTDSHSDESLNANMNDINNNNNSTIGMSSRPRSESLSRRQQKGRSGRLPLLLRKWSALDESAV